MTFLRRKNLYNHCFTLLHYAIPCYSVYQSGPNTHIYTYHQQPYNEEKKLRLLYTHSSSVRIENYSFLLYVRNSTCMRVYKGSVWTEFYLSSSQVCCDHYVILEGDFVESTWKRLCLAVLYIFLLPLFLFVFSTIIFFCPLQQQQTHFKAQLICCFVAHP